MAAMEKPFTCPIKSVWPSIPQREKHSTLSPVKTCLWSLVVEPNLLRNHPTLQRSTGASYDLILPLSWINPQHWVDHPVFQRCSWCEPIPVLIYDFSAVCSGLDLSSDIILALQNTEVLLVLSWPVEIQENLHELLLVRERGSWQWEDQSILRCRTGC
jgi:hypothetical protein